MKTNIGALLGVCVLAFALMAGCASQVSSTGVAPATATVQTNAAGHSVEQENLLKRAHQDNLPGAVKHLYVISPVSGQVLMYSTVDGKVTSSGKRLTPYSTQDGSEGAFRVDSLSRDGNTVHTNEVLQDDGTYGSSAEYLYWFDTAGDYHQIYPAGCACIITVNSSPLAVHQVGINFQSTS